MKTIFGDTRADFLLYQKLPRNHIFTKDINMQALAGNMLMGISTLKVVGECFLP